MKKILLIVLAQTFLFCTFSQSTFLVTTAGTTPEMDEAIDYVTGQWSQYLNSSVPIKINITYGNLGLSGTLGISVPNPIKNFTDTPLSDVWYPTSLANSIAGIELNTGEVDMDIFINSNADLYFGTDGNAAGQHDFVSLLMHEIIHGLGGLSLTQFEEGLGSIGFANDVVDFLPLSFDLPDLLELPSIWDTFIINGSGQFIVDNSLFANPSESLGDQLTSNDLFFIGAEATSANDDENPRIYAPTSFNAGSSIHHFNESTFPLSSGNSMFTPFLSTGEVVHNPGPVLLGALVDIGWSANLIVGVDEFIEESIPFYPNPTNGLVYMELNESKYELKMVDLMGNIVLSKFNSGFNDLSRIESGTYVIVGSLNGDFVSQKIVVLN